MQCTLKSFNYLQNSVCKAGFPHCALMLRLVEKRVKAGCIVDFKTLKQQNTRNRMANKKMQIIWEKCIIQLPLFFDINSVCPEKGNKAREGSGAYILRGVAE